MATLSPIPANAKFQDLTGQRFGKLIVLECIGQEKSVRFWICRCDCGTEKPLREANFKYGYTQSCGCLHRQRCIETHFRHGFTRGKNKTPEYKIWGSMIRRCHKETDNCFGRYGGRGIRVCDRWRSGEGGFSAFECFISDMGLRPSPNHSIERQDNDGDYEPSNCLWADRLTQARNKRNNVVVFYEGRTQKLLDICARTGVPTSCAQQRIKRYGWSVEDAVTKPSKSPGERKPRN